MVELENAPKPPQIHNLLRPLDVGLTDHVHHLHEGQKFTKADLCMQQTRGGGLARAGNDQQEVQKSDCQDSE
eukprot:Skav209588  [mRNA]  locus=scaffold1607:85126:87412:+ [translate_table: standard]